MTKLIVVGVRDVDATKKKGRKLFNCLQRKNLPLGSGGGSERLHCLGLSFSLSLKIRKSIIPSPPHCAPGIAKAPYLTTKGFKSVFHSSQSNFFHFCIENVMNGNFEDNKVRKSSSPCIRMGIVDNFVFGHILYFSSQRFSLVNGRVQQVF